MEHVLDSVEEINGIVTEKKLWINILVRPKETFSFILNHCPRKYVLFLLFLSGVERQMNHLSVSSATFTGENIAGSIYSFLLPFILYGSLTLLFYLLCIAILSWIGKKLGGMGNMDKTKAVVAWSLVPFCFPLVVNACSFILFRVDSFSFLLKDYPTVERIIFGLSYFLTIVAVVWSVILLVVGISVAQHFNINRSLINVVLSFLILIVPAFLVIMVLSTMILS